MCEFVGSKDLASDRSLMESHCKSHQKESAGTHQSDYTFKEEDVPGLAEVLAEVAYLWELMAVALRMSKTVIEDCRDKGSDLTIKLYHVLHTWVVGQHSNARQATLENLKAALASPLVQRRHLASELEDKLKTSLSLSTLSTSQKKSTLKSGVKEVLVKKYMKSPEVPHTSWPPVVNKAFINLALIETSGQPLKSDYSIRGDADDVLAVKKKVEYKKIFGIYEKGKSILVLGRPGSGKSTLVHKIVRDWSVGEALQGAELVFLVSLRALHSNNDRKLSDILRCLAFDEKNLELALSSIEQVQGDKVCFVLDGFDEYCPLNKMVSVIFALLNKSYLVNAMIILTSRPAAASASSDIKNNSFQKIEVFGFSKIQIKEYIDHFPFSPSPESIKGHTEKLYRFLESRPGVLDLCYLPVNCAIICFIYDTDPGNLPDTQTQMYALFTRLIILRQLASYNISMRLSSLDDLKGETAESFKKTCSLAFDMVLDNKQVVTGGPASRDEAHSLGLITTDVTADLSGVTNSYSFLHLTLQEFLAAYHLSKLDHKQQLSLIEKHSGSLHLRNMWKFYFGLESFDDGLEKAKKLLIKKQDLFKCQCLYETKQASITGQLVSSTHMLLTGTLSNYDISAIAYVISMAAQVGSATHIERLVFGIWGNSENDKLKSLISQLNDKALGFFEALTVSFCPISIADVEALADKLKLYRTEKSEAQGLKNLKSLKLLGVGMEDEGVAILAAGLTGNHVIEHLDLPLNSISATGISLIMKIDCHLHCLSLYNIDMDDEGARAVARELKNKPSLHIVDLFNNNITIAGVEALATALHKLSYETSHARDISYSNLPDQSGVTNVRDEIASDKYFSSFRVERPQPMSVVNYDTDEDTLSYASPSYHISINIRNNSFERGDVARAVKRIRESSSN